MKRSLILLFSIAFARISLSCNSTAASKSNNQTVVETPKPTVVKKIVPQKERSTIKCRNGHSLFKSIRGKASRKQSSN